MKYSQATNYALHTMLYFVALPPGTTIGVQRLAEIQELSPTYLSKILTRLVQGWHYRIDSGHRRRVQVDEKQSRPFFPGGHSCH